MRYFALFSIFACVFFSPAFAEPPTRPSVEECQGLIHFSPDSYYKKGMEALEKKEYKKAYFFLQTLVSNFSEYDTEAHYYLGYAYFKAEEYVAANEAFSDYLKTSTTFAYFERVMEYKYLIAEMLKSGHKRRLFDHQSLPKLVWGETLALEIFDEVIAALPSHELAARALFSKACLQFRLWQYKDSVETAHTLVKRFPKHELVPHAYLLVSKVYSEQTSFEFQNPDLLALSEMNLKKFKQHFPREERIDKAESDYQEVRENYAKGMIKTAEFYLRKGRNEAASIYFNNCIKHFPETKSAAIAKQHLNEKLAKDLFEKAHYYQNKKECTQAIAYYSELLENYPETTYAEKSREHLLVLAPDELANLEEKLNSEETFANLDE